MGAAPAIDARSSRELGHFLAEQHMLRIAPREIVRLTGAIGAIGAADPAAPAGGTS